MYLATLVPAIMVPVLCIPSLLVSLLISRERDVLLFDKNRLKVPYAEPYLAALLSASVVLILPIVIVIVIVLGAAEVRQRAHVSSARRGGAARGAWLRSSCCCWGKCGRRGLRWPCARLCTAANRSSHGRLQHPAASCLACQEGRA